MIANEIFQLRPNDNANNSSLVLLDFKKLKYRCHIYFELVRQSFMKIV